MDYVMQNVLEVNMLMKEYVDIPLASVLFEADEDSDTAKALDKNAEIETKSTNLIVRAIKAIKMGLDKIISGVKDFIQKIFLSSDQKEKIKLVEKYCRENEDFKNAKFTVDDFKNYEKIYDSAMAKLDALDKSPVSDSDSMTDIQNQIDQIMKTTDGIGSIVGNIAGNYANATVHNASSAVKRASIVVSSETLLRMAKENATMAKAICKAMETDKSYLEAMERELGKAKTDKFVNTMTKCTKSVCIYRWKVKLHLRKSKTLKDCLNDEVKKLTSMVSRDSEGNFKPNYIGILRNKKTIEDTTGKSIVDIGTSAYSARRAVNKANKKRQETMNFIFGDKKKSNKSPIYSDNSLDKLNKI